MASTNKTTNYELSQFLGADKPAWLTDYNSDMSKIDTGIHSAQTTATGADGKADANTTAIGTLTNLTTDAKTDLVVAINEVDSHADTAQGTAGSALTNANNAYTLADNLGKYFKLSNSNNLTLSASSTATNISTVSSTWRSAYNSDGSLGKVYGECECTIDTPAGNKTISISLGDTGLRPSTPITINAAVISQTEVSTRMQAMRASNLNIATNGVATFDVVMESGADRFYAFIQPFVIFAEDFGD